MERADWSYLLLAPRVVKDEIIDRKRWDYGSTQARIDVPSWTWKHIPSVEDVFPNDRGVGVKEIWGIKVFWFQNPSPEAIGVGLNLPARFRGDGDFVVFLHEPKAKATLEVGWQIGLQDFKVRF